SPSPSLSSAASCAAPPPCRRFPLHALGRYRPCHPRPARRRTEQRPIAPRCAAACCPAAMKPLSIVAAALLAAVVDATAVAPAEHKLDARADLAYSPPHYPSPWMDPDAPGWQDAYEKAKDFVSQLTLVEKVNITTGVGWMGDNCVGNVGSVPRLGLKALCMQDGPLGIRLSDYNSAFPAALTAAASFSRDLWHERGEAMGSEAKGKGVTVLLGPVAGPLGRTPEGGRNAEGFGADPYLQGQGLANTVQGIQDAGVVACAKHYVANEQEHFRDTVSSNLDDKTLHEYYAWPFADAVKAGLGAIMCSYNQVNNSYACQNSRLLNGVLKGEMGFQGFVMSDWQAQHSGVATAAAGLDMTMPGDTLFNTGISYWGPNLTLAVANGTVPEWRIDDMAMRIMAAFFKVGNTVKDQVPTNFNAWTRDSFGWTDQAVQENWGHINQQVDVRADHAAHIRESAAKGTVVLKNTGGALPLNKPKFLAVIGEDAGPNPRGPNGCGDRGCDDGTLAMLWGSGTSNFPYLITPDSALQAQVIKDGGRYESILTNYAPAETRALVSQPDVTAIVFANADSGEGYIDVDGNTGDRKNLTLWKNGDDLIKSVASVNPNTVVVIHSVGPVLVTDWYANPNITAIVWAGLPGQESGNSLVDLLYGNVDGGRSPFTWGPTRESYGTDVMYTSNNGNGVPQQDFTEGVFVDYRHFDKVAPNAGDPGAPIFEFGFGLSWSNFTYSPIYVQKHNAKPYQPASGKTIAAPTFGSFSTDLASYAFPAGIRIINQWIYPWLKTTTSGKEASGGDVNYGQTADQFLPPGATDGSPQPRLPASGEPGGNPRLWDVMYTVTCTVFNVGKRTSGVVPQLYVGLGGEGDPVRVLRGFQRIEKVEPESQALFKATLTRRDLSSWDPVKQDWVVTDAPKTVWVGSSSRDLPVKAVLN
ncbi:Beta-glucosidase, partial [Tolypocladium capitatum]